MLRKTGAFFALVAFLMLSSLVPFSGKAHAAPLTNPTIDFQALQKTCAVIEIRLNGAQHTITCTKPRTSIRKGVKPLLSQSPCLLSDELEVKNYNYSGDLCFSGLGYLGVKIYQVDEVDNHSPFYQTWIRDYDPSGSYCTIEPGSFALFSTNNPAFVTQLDENGAQGSDCPQA